MNIKLLNRVKKYILAEPRRYNQNATLRKLDEYDRAELGSDKPPCNTLGCIAGWTCHLSGDTPRKRNSFNYERARKALGLTPKEADRLFAYTWNIGAWPEKFLQKYDAAKTPAGRARAAAQRIEHFIKTDGKE
jgi:hypothetical protein